jgi:hypothetical protein
MGGAAGGEGAPAVCAVEPCAAGVGHPSLLHCILCGVHGGPLRVAAGEPFTLVVEVTGVGNVDAVEPPSWSGNGSARLFPPTLRRERRDRDGVVAGRVVVETLVQQNEAGTVHVPALSLVTFSPDEGRYITRSAPPIDVVVGQGVAAPSSSRSSSLGRRSEVGQGQRPLALDIDARGSSPSDRPRSRYSSRLIE